VASVRALAIRSRPNCCWW